ncbi:MAG: ABC transporter ATP-binding protein [Acidimicrobiales bacterium]|nr:ABC transporter ATP-binding protein [Acidimicrobiales bacterium]
MTDQRREDLLVTESLDAGYAGVPVLRGIDLSVPTGSLAVVLGANGAGKTTLLRSIMGLAERHGGTVRVAGEECGHDPVDMLARGVVMVPEGRRLFGDLTVDENLETGALVGVATARRSELRDMVFDLFPRVRERVDQRARTLSGGEQQMVAIGRALMSDPSTLLIDEASLGLAPVIVDDLFDMIADVNRAGITVVAVEQNLAVLDLASHGYLLEQGRMRAGGSMETHGAQIRALITEAYLGVDDTKEVGA